MRPSTVCISTAGGYVVAVEGNRLLALDNAKEAEFHRAMYSSIEPVQLEVTNQNR